MSKKEEKAREYAKIRYGCNNGNQETQNEIAKVQACSVGFVAGWDTALKSILVDASKELPEYEVDVWVINEKGEQFYCHRSKNKKVKAYKDEWCNYTGSDIIAWVRPTSFEEILKLNKDILERLKD